VDFRHEGNNTQLLSDILKTTSPAPLSIPAVIFQSRDLLILGHQPGIHPTQQNIGTRRMRNLYRVLGGTWVYTSIVFGVVHGDLHPGNILYDVDTDEISLIDLGTCVHVPILYNHPFLVLCSIFATQEKDTSLKHTIFTTFFSGTYNALLLHDFLYMLFETGATITIDQQIVILKLLEKKYHVGLNANVIHFMLRTKVLMDSYTRLSPGHYTMAIFVWEALQLAQRSHHPQKVCHVQVLQMFHDFILMGAPLEMDSCIN
jgi:serine/threonine protein kinase